MKSAAEFIWKKDFLIPISNAQNDDDTKGEAIKKWTASLKPQILCQY